MSIVVANELCRPDSKKRLEKVTDHLFPGVKVEWIDDIGMYLLNKNEGEVVVVTEKSLKTDEFAGIIKNLHFSVLKVIRLSVVLGLDPVFIEYELGKIEEEWQIVSCSKKEIYPLNEDRKSNK